MRAVLLAVALAGCSNASLYGKAQENNEPDRLALSGRVCTTDARKANFPVKVLFLVDTAAGPVYADYDPEQLRLRAIDDTVSTLNGDDRFTFAVAQFGSQPRLLAPIDTSESFFTRNPGELGAAVQTLGLSQGCNGPVCRDYEDGIDLARSVIEGDLASLTPGERLRTQYAIVLVGGGPPNPLDTDLDTTITNLREQLLDLREDVMDTNALSFNLHALHLAAPDLQQADPTIDVDATEALLEELAFVGAGRFERFDVADAISLEGIGLLRLESLLEVKSLLVTNLNAVPTREGHKMDSDADGLSDLDELQIGTLPTERDTDGDSLGDFVETLVTMDPLFPEHLPSTCALLDDPYADTDNDHLRDCEEMIVGTSPFLPDSDGDGLPDWVEVSMGTDYLNADGLDDADFDGANNGDELLEHTDPRSGDATAHLADAYRYELTDEGQVIEPVVNSPKTIPGIEVLSAGPGTAGGLGSLTWDPPNLTWQDAADEEAGQPVEVVEVGRYTVNSATEDKWLELEVTPKLLPPKTKVERLLAQLSDRQCMQYTVRNVRLLETNPDGKNDVFLYFAQAPVGQLTSPGLFRLAHIPVTYEDGVGRTPSDAVVEVRNDEFVAIGD